MSNNKPEATYPLDLRYKSENGFIITFNNVVTKAARQGLYEVKMMIDNQHLSTLDKLRNDHGFKIDEITTHVVDDNHKYYLISWR